MRQVTRSQAVAYRLSVNHLAHRLPTRAYDLAARYGLQDTGPRDALVALHARVQECEPSAWEDKRLIQTYSPRAAVYVLPVKDFGVFTIGRLPLDPERRAAVEDAAEAVCRTLDGREVRGGNRIPDVRAACASGRIALRWTASAVYVREVPRPEDDPQTARIELCRRHIHAFGPSTPSTFAWWAGLSPGDGHQIWRLLEPELREVELAGQQAWILADDEAVLVESGRAQGVRLLPEGDLRLFGADRTGCFVGPGLHRTSPLHDWHHPHGLVVDGEVVGAWGRSGGKIRVKVPGPLTSRDRERIEAEALSMPIPGVTMDVDITVC